MTTFIRLLEVAVDEKGDALRDAIRVGKGNRQGSKTPRNAGEKGGERGEGRLVFEVEPAEFKKVPGSPFAYWVSETIRALFDGAPQFESGGRTAKCGAGTLDDFRFLRLSWESSPACADDWPAFAKGGAYSPFYADIHLRLGWSQSGRELQVFVEDKVGSATRKIQAQGYYFRPGLTWPRRTNGLSFRVLPKGCIFADKGPAAFVDGDYSDDLLAVAALMNSKPFGYLVSVQLARTELAQSYEVGLIQQTPVPELKEEDRDALATLAKRAWSLKRSLDTTNETTHAFVLPPGLNEMKTGLDAAAIESELLEIQREIDERVFVLYGIGDEDRAAIEASAKKRGESRAEEGEEDDDEGEEEPLGVPALPVLSWLVGVAFGRFDERLATGERAIPNEPEPFDKLPSRSPGMWPEGEEPRFRSPDILVDDPGNNEDISAHVANAAAHTGIPDPSDLRQWLAREFFPLHIKMYSKSRRKAPIYWQLATPSASYSVWLYIHAFTRDTMHRVQSEYVAPKLALEERKLEELRSSLGPSPKPAERREVEKQETFVEELRAFRDEVKRIVPLWNPQLDDGVVINFAPLFRLVPHHTSWQRELKMAWDALVDGKYDWAHLAMRLWPERVIPKCATDRSLAIAHGLEDVFWEEGEDGRWRARREPTLAVEEMIRERTSAAVKEAVESLEEAPISTRPRRGGRGRRGRNA